jgi:hypothetical protein
MNITVQFSDKKLELMGEAAALLFKLKMDRHGSYSLRAGQKVTKIGLARTVIGMVEETSELTEKELEKFVSQRRLKA